MAEIAFTKVSAPNYQVFTWTPVGQSDTFAPVKLDRTPYSVTFQTSGTYSGSASVGLNASLDGTTYAAMEDMDGTAIALTAAGMRGTRLAALYFQPTLSSGDGSTAITGTLLVRYA